MLRHPFWLLKPHQKPVACIFELYPSSVRLVREKGVQLFKFSMDKVHKWSVGKADTFLELQIQVGKVGPAGSLKFQIRDSSTTDDVRAIVARITEIKGGGDDGGGVGGGGPASAPAAWPCAVYM